MDAVQELLTDDAEVADQLTANAPDLAQLQPKLEAKLDAAQQRTAELAKLVEAMKADAQQQATPEEVVLDESQ